MIERVDAELAMVRAWYPDLELREGPPMTGRLPAYPVPSGWGVERVELVFQVPSEFPGQEPYGIWIRPALVLPNGSAPSNTSPPVATAFGEGWQQFSFAPERWAPGATPQAGSNLLTFIRSFGDRLREVN